MFTIIFSYILFLVIIGFLFIRNKVTFRIGIDAINLVHTKALQQIAAGDSTSWRELYVRLDERSYDSIMFDPFCWTVKSAYPWLFEEAKE